jgi:hypothetical protein
MADQTANAAGDKGPVYTRKAATLPASIASITVGCEGTRDLCERERGTRD